MKNMHSKSTDEDEEDEDGSKESDPVGELSSFIKYSFYKILNFKNSYLYCHWFLV